MCSYSQNGCYLYFCICVDSSDLSNGLHSIQMQMCVLCLRARARAYVCMWHSQRDSFTKFIRLFLRSAALISFVKRNSASGSLRGTYSRLLLIFDAMHSPISIVGRLDGFAFALCARRTHAVAAADTHVNA